MKKGKLLPMTLADAATAVSELDSLGLVFFIFKKHKEQ